MCEVGKHNALLQTPLVSVKLFVRIFKWCKLVFMHAAARNIYKHTDVLFIMFAGGNYRQQVRPVLLTVKFLCLMPLKWTWTRKLSRSMVSHIVHYVYDILCNCVVQYVFPPY